MSLVGQSNRPLTWKATDVTTVATKAKADEDKNTSSTAKQDQSRTQKTTAEERDNKDDKSQDGKVGDVEETDAEAAASGNVKGAVARGDTGLEKMELDDASEGKSLEGRKDVPYTYLTPEHFDGDNGRTSDADDPARSWAVQDTEGEGDDERPIALINVESEPGQTFHQDELPNVDVMRAAGIDSAQYLTGLPVKGEIDLEEGYKEFKPGAGALG